MICIICDVKYSLHFLRFCAIIQFSLTAATARTWTSADGKSTFDAALIEYDAASGQVTLDRAGKKITLKQDTLSASDVSFLQASKPSSAQGGPPHGSKWKLIPELSDEFTGDKLDAGKWFDHDPGWKGREPGFFSKKNVAVSDGKLHLTARVETLENLPKGYHTFTTAAVKSKAAVKYGFFEIKCRPMKSKASSAFWFYKSEKEQWTEIDVFEICGVEDKWKNSYNMNAHVFHTPTEKKHFQKPGKWKAPFNFVDDYHIYAVEWNKDVIKWLVDGKVVHQLKNTHWHQALNMVFDSETFPDWFGLPTKDSLPATFSIEYVRSWSKQEDQ